MNRTDRFELAGRLLPVIEAQEAWTAAQRRLVAALRDHGPQSGKYRKARQAVAKAQQAWRQAKVAAGLRNAPVARPARPLQAVAGHALVPTGLLESLIRNCDALCCRLREEGTLELAKGEEELAARTESWFFETEANKLVALEALNQARANRPTAIAVPLGLAQTAYALARSRLEERAHDTGLTDAEEREFAQSAADLLALRQMIVAAMPEAPPCAT